MKIDFVKKNISQFNRRCVGVIGDLMLDVYVWGKVSRISQEAPVPIAQIKKQTQSLGGAANVMRNATSLGANSEAFGLIGDDENGQILRNLLKQDGIGSNCVYEDNSRQTTVKKRVIAGGQQLLRIDYEDLHPISKKLKNRLLEDVEAKINAGELDALIFEDYAKGLLDPDMAFEINQLARSKGILTALDPHPSHPINVRGITLMTPNRQEAFHLAGIYYKDPECPAEEDQILMDVADKLAEKFDPDYLLITLGSQGMALFPKDGDFIVIPTRAREVFDVSGAGDTVIAAFTLALLGGASGKEAAIIANHAAGVVVGKVGTVSVTSDELLASFEL